MVKWLRLPIPGSSEFFNSNITSEPTSCRTKFTPAFSLLSVYNREEVLQPIAGVWNCGKRVDSEMVYK
jgi:hypothetical protein